MQALLYANLTERTLSDTLGGPDFDWPELIEGDSVRIGLRFAQTLGDEALEIERVVRLVRASLGRLDTRPASGQWAIQIGDDSSEEGVNTTALLDHDATAEDVQSAVQALFDAPGFSVTGFTADGVTVDAKDGSWLLRFQEGGHPYPDELDLRAGRNALDPISFLRSRTYPVDGRWVHELRLVQAPAAFIDTSAPVAPLAPAIDVVQQGGSEGEIEWNEIQSLTVPPSFRGAYQVKRPDTFARSGLLSVADGIDQIAGAIEPLADEDGVFRVTNPLPHVAHIEFAGSMAGQAYDPLVVEVVTAPPGDVTFELSLATAGVANLLRAAPVVEDLPFEIEVTYEDEHDPDELHVWTYRTEVTLRRELIHEELASTQNIDWIRPPLPRDYVPFTPDQIITGVQHYVTTLGDGVQASFVIDHNLATEALHLTLRENASSGAILRPGIDFEAATAGPDSIAVTLLGDFASPPATGALAIVISTAGPVSVFQAHTHTIPQVEGLQAILDAFGADIAALKALTPSDFATRDPGAGRHDDLWAVSSFGAVFPLSGRNIAFVFPETHRLEDVDETTLPRQTPGLLPAVHDAVVEPLPVQAASGTLLVPPASHAFSGRVFQNQEASVVYLPGGLGRLGTRLAPGEHAACDGRVWYRVVQYGGESETSWYADDLAPLLWWDAVKASDLRPGRRFTCLFQTAVRTIRANTAWHWTLAIEVGQFPQDASPALTGSNIASADWDAAAVLKDRLIVGPTPRRYEHGYRVTRNKAGELSAEERRGGVWTPAEAPASEEFGIRARLIRGDTENPVSDPRGFLAYAGPREPDVPVRDMGYCRIHE